MKYEEMYAEELKHDRYVKGLQALGMEIVGETLICNRPYRIARKQFTYSELVIYFDRSGNAKLEKPNRTTKWVYEKSPAQLHRVAEQVISFYRDGGTR